MRTSVRSTGAATSRSETPNLGLMARPTSQGSVRLDNHGNEHGVSPEFEPAARSLPRLTWSFAAVSVTPETSTPPDRGLTIGAEDDPLEREADRMAEHALRTPITDSATEGPRAHGMSASLATMPVLQRKCAPCKEEEERLRRKPAPGSSPAPHRAPEIVGETLGSGNGRPLDGSTRAFFEKRYAHDFSHVRVFNDGRAAAAAAAVDAHAFTVGNKIVFAEGQYTPQTNTGRQLLAHELAHVVQQKGNSSAGQSARGMPTVRRRTVRRTYSAIASERGPICDVNLAITGAPASDTDDLREFINAAMDGILSACGTLPRTSSRAIRVTLPYRRGMLHTDVEQRAYVAARISVLGRVADPAYIAEQERLAAERARVARLDANYRRAVRDGNWQMAAEYLNGFNDADINSRLRSLNLTQLGELRRGAVNNPRLGGGTRLTAAIDRANPDARRVATLIENYETALAASNWTAAAEYLNGFNDTDIRARLRRLDRLQLSELRNGAIRNPRLRRGARLVGLIDSVTTPPLLLGVGAACFDGATVTVTKNRTTHACTAFSGSIGDPTPNGRFCVRPQGEAQRAGGITGRLFQDRTVWYLLEPQFTTTRSRMQLHPGTMSSGCITVTDRSCFDRLARVLNSPGTDTGRGYDGYPPGNSAGVTNPQRNVDCVAWLDVTSTRGGCRP